MFLTYSAPCTTLAKISVTIFAGRQEMNKNKHLALAALGFFLAGCTGMTKNQAALVGASVCGAMGAMGGAAVAHNGARIKASEAEPSISVLMGLPDLVSQR